MNYDTNKIIDGKKIADTIISEIKSELASVKTIPGLALIIAGNNPASEAYVRMKEKKCAELGFYSVVEKLPQTVTEFELLGLVNEFNNDKDIHGLLIQLPLPRHINELKVLEAVNYKKDVDGFHPINSGRLVIGEKCFVPCTPAGIIELLKRYNINTHGKNAVVLGRSNIVGKPITNLLYQKNRHADSTVTICHSSTKDISLFTKNADIIIAAIGKPGFLKGNMISEGCAIIDVGINRVEDSAAKKGYRLTGDVDFDSCYPKASYITPVPGGVGPMTIAMLMRNTLDSALGKIYG